MKSIDSPTFRCRSFYLDYRRASQDIPGLASLLGDPKFDNVLQIGLSSPETASWLLNGNTDHFRFEATEARQLPLLFELAKKSGLRSLVIELSGSAKDCQELEDEDFVRERTELEACSWRVRRIGSALCLLRPDAVTLDLSRLNITDDGFFSMIYILLFFPIILFVPIIFF